MDAGSVWPEVELNYEPASTEAYRHVILINHKRLESVNFGPER